MTIDDDERLYLFFDARCDADLTAAPSVALEIGTTLYPMTWISDAVQSGATWTRRARTDKTFIGTSLSAGPNDAALGAGRHLAQPIVTLADGQTVAGPRSWIEVT